MMKKNRKLNRYEIEKLAFNIVTALKDAGFKETYFVGGYVRDKILGILPEKDIDIDIATEARKEGIKRVFKNEKFIDVGEAFNIIMLIKKGHKFEIATFREDIFDKDKNKWDGRHPEKVKFATAKEDAERRDFTVNAIFYDPVEKKHIDYVNGIEDIKKKIIRTIGKPSERFREDYLRMLRAIRFTVQKDFDIDSEIIYEIKKNASKISSISKERILIELTKILKSNNPHRGFELLVKTNLINFVFSNKNNTTDDNTSNFIYTCLKKAPDISVIRWTFFLYYYISSEMDFSEIKSLLIENRFDNKTIKDIALILSNKKKMLNWDKLSELEKAETVSNGQFENSLLLQKIEIEILSDKEQDIILKNIEKYYLNLKSNSEKWAQINKFTLIDGNNLLKMGVKGKEVGAYLKNIKELYARDIMKTKAEILTYLKERIKTFEKEKKL